MNFLNMRNRTMAITCLLLLQLSSCYASPVRSPRTSAVKLRNILANMQRVTRSDQPTQRQDYHNSHDEENGVAVNHPPTTEDVPADKPETIDDTFRNPDVSEETEQPVHSDSIENVTPSEIQGVIESESTLKFEESSYPKTVEQQEPQAPIETFEPYHPPTVAAPSDPAELPLMYPLVRVPTAPLVTPIITVADLPLENVLPSTAALPEKAEISSSTISGPEQGDNVVALPLDLDTKVKTQTSSSSVNFDSQIQVDQPKYHPNISYDNLVENKVSNSSSRPFGSTPKLRELGFPPISNTQDNFGVQVNWAEFRYFPGLGWPVEINFRMVRLIDPSPVEDMPLYIGLIKPK